MKAQMQKGSQKITGKSHNDFTSTSSKLYSFRKTHLLIIIKIYLKK